MLAWDKHVGPHLDAISRMGQVERWSLAVACLEDVRPFLAPLMEHVTLPGMQSFIDSAFALLTTARDALQVPVGDANALLGVSSGCMDGTTPPGIWDFAGGLIVLLRRAGGDLSTDDVSECLSQAYQVVLNIEVLAKLKEEVAEDEVQKMEKANGPCMDCMNKQVRRIADLRPGPK